jgi:hypothetical protein
VRTLPSARQTAVVDLSHSRGESFYVTTRMRHLPCPIRDLRHVVARYNFKDLQSVIYSSSQTHRPSAVDLGVREKAFYLLDTLRAMADVNLEKATNLKDVRLEIIGLQPRRDGESYFQAVRRILGQPNADPVSAENLAQKILYCGRKDAGVVRGNGTHQLAVFKRGSLLLVVPKNNRE